MTGVQSLVLWSALFDFPELGKESARSHETILNPGFRDALTLENKESFVRGLCSGRDESGQITVEMSFDMSMFDIPADCQKSEEEQLLPMAPEFAAMLREVPLAERTGRVFKIWCKSEKFTPKLEHISPTNCKLGELAGVKVLHFDRSGAVKYGSAHDFRRSFGERWSVRVMAAVLQQTMRHKDTSTTMKFYFGTNASVAAIAMYEAFEKTNSKQVTPEVTHKPRG